MIKDTKGLVLYFEMNDGRSYQFQKEWAKELKNVLPTFDFLDLDNHSEVYIADYYKQAIEAANPIFLIIKLDTEGELGLLRSLFPVLLKKKGVHLLKMGNNPKISQMMKLANFSSVYELNAEHQIIPTIKNLIKDE